MAGQKLTQKTALTEQTGSGDLFMVVDVSDTTSSADGTSKKFDSKFLLQTDKISLTNAEVLDLDSDEKTLVGALSGYMVVPYCVTMLGIYGASTESARKDLIFGYSDTGLTHDSQYWSKISDCMDTQTTNITYCVGPVELGKAGTYSSSIINKPFIVYAEGTGFNGGWSCDIYVTYAYVKVL